MKDRSLNGNGEGASSHDSGRGPVRFPELPILNIGLPTPAPSPARSQAEKYGGLFYLGIAGLILLLGLIGWFGYGLWSNRDLWVDVYRLNDASRSETDRVAAALRLGENPRLADAQKMELSLRKDLPELARYLLAESVSTELAARDPRSYAMVVARSPDWPDWLRLVLSRRLAYGAGRGYDIPIEPLDELKRHSDPLIRLWAAYALAVLPRSSSDPARVAELEEAARSADDRGELAVRLLGAIRAEGERESRLDEATTWLRRHHPQAARIWRGWEIRNQQIARDPLQ